MDMTSTAYGTWNGGKYMHFGEALDDARFHQGIRLAYERGIRTFVTSDVYGNGRADEYLGEALADYPRNSYCLVGALGHDFYEGVRQGASGYPRFTSPDLRDESGYASFLNMAAEKCLERCRTTHFDILLLHNPDERGYTNDAVWEALLGLKKQGLTQQLGMAPGPANGFTLDLIHCFEKFGQHIDWSMIILNPLEPWPGQHIIPAAREHNVKLLTRVVDYGGLFWGDVPRGHEFRQGDHRTWRPKGWVEHGHDKLDRMEDIRRQHGLSLLQLACYWNLAQHPVLSVVPTIIQEAAEGSRTYEDKVAELAAIDPSKNPLTPADVEAIRQLGDNTGCMALKGGSQRHQESTRPDEWPMREDLLAVAGKYGLGNAW
jgi:aryl-alcohol dehydrogenase-like predicted oxidoreductase